MASFDWSTLLGDGELLKKDGNITVDSLSSKDVVGFYFSVSESMLLCCFAVHKFAHSFY